MEQASAKAKEEEIKKKVQEQLVKQYGEKGKQMNKVLKPLWTPLFHIRNGGTV